MKVIGTIVAVPAGNAFDANSGAKGVCWTMLVPGGLFLVVLQVLRSKSRLAGMTGMLANRLLESSCG